MTKDVSRTVHAQQAMEITDLFSYKFGALRFGTATPRRLKLLEPDGPSTAGGKQARQSLVLQTDDDPQKGLMLGWIDTAQSRSEVKALGALERLHQQRFGAPLDLGEAEYRRMVDELAGFLKIQRISVTEVDAPPAPAPLPTPRAPAASAGPSAGPGAGAFAVVFAAGIAVGLLLGYLVFG